MVTQKPNLLIVLFLAFFMCLPGVAMAQDTPAKDGLEFFVDLYGWMPNIHAESASGSDAEIDLGTIFDDLQFVLMGMLGAKKDKWGFTVDVIYMDLEDDNNSTKLLPGGIPVNVYTDVELKSWVVTPAVSYNILEKDKFKLDLLAGARYLYLDADLSVDFDGVRNRERSISGSDSGHNWDGIAGIKGEVTLNEKWYLPYYLDIGTGDSELTYQAFGGFGYRFSRVDLIVGYRHLRWDFDDNPALDHLYITGPIAGVKIRF